MEWQAVVFALQILLLVTGWVLFQKARADLSARAAETPVLGEVKALQRNVKQLLTDMEQASERTSIRLETRCTEAQTLLTALEQRLSEWDAKAAMPSLPPTPPENAPRTRRKKSETLPQAPQETTGQVPATAVVSPQAARRQRVYGLADTGDSAVVIARETGLSEGEVETLLALRPVQRVS